MNADPSFRPARWLRGAFLQSVAASTGAPRDVASDRVEVPVSGGHLVGRLQRAPGSPPRGAVLVLHGAAGSSDEPYVLRTAAKLVRLGFDALRLSLRGSGESIACARPILHAGAWEDAHAAIDWLRARYPRIGLIGFSLGGQIALKAAAAWGDRPPREIGAAAAVSPPLDLHRSTRFLDRPAALLYRAYIMSQLRRQYRAVERGLPAELRGLSWLHFRRADLYNERLVAPLFGHPDVAHYYARASSGPDLGAIAIPSLVIHAEDDPVVPVRPALEARAGAPRNVRFVITRSGGHVGFVADDATGEPDRFWAENLAVRFVTRALAAA